MSGRELSAVLADLEAVRALVAQHATVADRVSAYPNAVHDALCVHGLYRLWLPREFDGDELAVPDALTVFEEASRLDGSLGFLVTIGTGGGLFAATMREETAREVFGPREALIAGSGARGGVATPVVGGYRVTGRWRYASGARHATWFTANCVVDDGSASGNETVRAMTLPASEVAIEETWRVTGLRATESHDFSVRDTFVPEARSFDVLGTPRISGALYRFPFGTIAQCSFAAVALGIARHGLEVFGREVAPARRDEAAARLHLEGAVVRLDAARAEFHAVARQAWETVMEYGVLGDAQQVAVQNAARAAAATAVAVVEGCYLRAGMAVLAEDSAFGRCWRDVHAISQHSAIAASDSGARGAS